MEQKYELLNILLKFLSLQLDKNTTHVLSIFRDSGTPKSEESPQFHMLQQKWRKMSSVFFLDCRKILTVLK